MSLIKISADLGNCAVDLVFDDASMRLTGISVANKTARKVEFYLTKPAMWSSTSKENQDSAVAIPIAQQPPWSWGPKRLPTGEIVQAVTGIDWRACFGM